MIPSPGGGRFACTTIRCRRGCRAACSYALRPVRFRSARGLTISSQSTGRGNGQAESNAVLRASRSPDGKGCSGAITRPAGRDLHAGRCASQSKRPHRSAHRFPSDCLDQPNRCRDRSRAFSASTWRSRGCAVVESESRRAPATAAISSTAVANAASFACEGLLKPLSFRTNCNEAARISSCVAGGLKLNSVLMFRHMAVFLWRFGSRENEKTEIADFFPPGVLLAKIISDSLPTSCRVWQYVGGEILRPVNSCTEEYRREAP